MKQGSSRPVPSRSRSPHDMTLGERGSQVDASQPHVATYGAPIRSHLAERPIHLLRVRAGTASNTDRGCGAGAAAAHVVGGEQQTYGTLPCFSLTPPGRQSFVASCAPASRPNPKAPSSNPPMHAFLLMLIRFLSRAEIECNSAVMRRDATRRRWHCRARAPQLNLCARVVKLVN